MKIEINLDEKYDDTMKAYAEIHAGGDVAKFAADCIIKQIDSAAYWPASTTADGTIAVDEENE